MSAINHHKARVGALSRSRPADDPELLIAKADLEKAKNSAVIDKLVAEAPELTSEQRTKLAELLRPVRVSTAHRKTVVAGRIADLDGGGDHAT